jgi:hypothetical protein
VAKGATQPTARLSWSTIRTPDDAHVARVRQLVEGAYESLRSRCGNLPSIAHAEYECWHKGCVK